MNAVRRGISDHLLVEMIELTYQRLRVLGITGRAADRCMTGIFTRACEFTPEQAIEAANRLFPSTQGGDDGDRD